MEQVRIQQKKNPRDEAGFLSIVFFWWMNPLLALGYNRDLELEDLYGPRKEDQSEVGGTVMRMNSKALFRSSGIVWKKNGRKNWTVLKRRMATLQRKMQKKRTVQVFSKPCFAALDPVMPYLESSHSSRSVS